MNLHNGLSAGSYPPLKNLDASIGVNVKETNSENAPANTIVRPNCLKNCPVIPSINAIGKKTAISQSVIAIAAIPISIRPFSAASLGDSPSLRCRVIFSNTTIESSTSIPIHNVIPIRDIMLNVNPAKYITKKVDISDVGIAIITARVERQPRRNKKSTSPVVIRPSINVPSVLWSDVRM